MQDRIGESADSKVAVFEERLRGRRFFEDRAWADAFRSLNKADKVAPLDAEDLERLATSAYQVGRHDEFIEALERAYGAYVSGGQPTRAARCAFWIGLSLLLVGEMGRGTGWLSGARRLVDSHSGDCVERGFLLLPTAEQLLGAGNFGAASAIAEQGVEIGERFDEPDLIACARHLHGRAVIGQGRVEAGLALLDEAMIPVIADALSPLMTGLVYCSVIDACQQVYALARAREWTSALTRWCEGQPQMIAFSGTCLVHRAELLQLRGAWHDAIGAARHACERSSRGADPNVQAAAFYQQGEVLRLRGEFARADAAYRDASRKGRDPQPGLALLRLAEGQTEIAAAAIRRALSSATEEHLRTRLLPAHIEIMLAVNDTESAGQSYRELEKIAKRLNASALTAMAAQARGALELADGNAEAALGALHQAFEAWQRVDAPYEVAKVRLLMGVACQSAGDQEGAGLEFEAARTTFESLGAAPDLAHVGSLTTGSSSMPTHSLTRRELQVLRLVAAGMTNKAIAAELFLSRKTVERHISNIFNKLDVPSRTAATAYAYEHRLI